LSPENTSKKLKWHLGPAGTVICMAITKEREEINTLIFVSGHPFSLQEDCGYLQQPINQ